MNHKNLVSVVITTYNSEATITDCLRSIANQTFEMIEVVVADNFSFDSTRALAQQEGAQVLTQSGKRGNVSSAKNFGLVNSNGEYVLFLDSDEVLERKVVEECVRLCQRGVGMVKIPLRFVGRDIWSSSSAFWRNCHYNLSKRKSGNFPRFFRRKHLGQVAYDENLVWGEDLALYMRLKSSGIKEAYCKSFMLHLEPDSLKQMIIKHMNYAEGMTSFSKRIDRSTYLNLSRNALSALLEAFRTPPNPSYILATCLVFLFFKTQAMAVGLLRTRLAR
jgi:glycosyltransferase involved in cell wall biosynthesis